MNFVFKKFRNKIIMFFILDELSHFIKDEKLIYKG